MSKTRKATSPQRAMAILSCIRLGMLTLALLALPFVLDDVGLGVQVGMIAGGLVCGWFTWKAYKRASDPELDRGYVPIDERPAPEQRAMRKRALLVSAAGCAVLSGMAWWEISHAAPGESISMWAPMAMMYDLAGPWGAILFPVGLWVALALFVAWKHRGLRAAEAR